MKTTMIESVLSLRRFRRLASFALIGMALAVAGMTQIPSAPIELPTIVPVSPPQCPSQVILAGDIDNFSAGGSDTTAPSVTLQNLIPGPYANFDDTTHRNVRFAHTFRLPPCKCLVGAKLQFRAKALGTDGSSSSGNDSITLGFSTLNGFPRWGAYLGSGNPSSAPWLSSPAWGANPKVRTFSLDLAALPTSGGPGSFQGQLSLLSAMQTSHYLDFYVQDDTSIDYIKLTVTMCDCCQQEGRAKICITKIYDKNRNGVKNPGEPVLSGWKFQAKDQAGGNVFTSVPTNATGRTCIGVLAPATYKISEIVPNGWIQTFPTNPANPVVTVTPGGPIVNLEFGNWRKKGLPDDPNNPQ